MGTRKSSIRHVDAPNLDNHSFPTPLNIGAGDYPGPATPASILGGPDLSYLPEIAVCNKDLTGGLTNNCKTTSDLEQVLIDGQFVPSERSENGVLRGLAARTLFPQWLSDHLTRTP